MSVIGEKEWHHADKSTEVNGACSSVRGSGVDGDGEQEPLSEVEDIAGAAVVDSGESEI